MEIKLDVKTILEKEFNTGLRGYIQKDVDLFLDDVIVDYQTFKDRIKTLEEELETVTKELAQAQETIKEKEKQLEEAKKRPQAMPNTSGTNYDILRRISNLERHVFGDKLSDDKQFNDGKTDEF
ncbi:MAG TPA: cell division regulator GpsB [Sporosarcina sp.]|nr:cell division regulator GpsB [Sporosarcina sp.]